MKPKTKNVTASFTGALCLVAVLGLGLFAGQKEAIAGDAAKIGAAAPAFTLPSVVDGSEVSLEAHKGKVVEVMFHSINCPFYKMHEG